MKRIMPCILLFCLSFPLFSQGRENEEIYKLPLMKDTPFGNSILKPVVIIDPGHGGRDPGAVAKVEINSETIYLQEKDINLQIGQLMAILLADYNEWEVLMTRTDDSTLTISERSALINDNGRETLLISLHQNYSRITATNGFTIYYGWNSKCLADKIAQGLTNTIGGQIPLREVKHGNWGISEQQATAAIRIDCGFLSNGYEAALLVDEEFQRKIGSGIIMGIEEYWQCKSN